MSQADLVTSLNGAAIPNADPPTRFARLILLIAIVGGAALGSALASPESAARATEAAGQELTRLIHFMVAVKSLMAIGAGLAVGWRLSSSISGSRLAVYAGLMIVMSAGLIEMWRIADVALGALMFHVGLLTTGVLLWRDPGSIETLARARAARARACI